MYDDSVGEVAEVGDDAAAPAPAGIALRDSVWIIELDSGLVGPFGRK